MHLVDFMITFSTVHLLYFLSFSLTLISYHFSSSDGQASRRTHDFDFFYFTLSSKRV